MSDGDAVFEFFDDFTGDSLNMNKWGVDTNLDSYSLQVENSLLKIIANYPHGTTERFINTWSKSDLPIPFIVKAKISPKVYPLNHWYHVVGVYENERLCLYINGEFVSTANAIYSLVTNNYKLLFAKET